MADMKTMTNLDALRSEVVQAWEEQAKAVAARLMFDGAGTRAAMLTQDGQFKLRLLERMLMDAYIEGARDGVRAAARTVTE